MTDVIGTLATMVSDWNTEEKCGFCWEFTAPMRESDLNEYQMKGDACCVLVAITDYRFQCNAPWNRVTGRPTLGSQLHTFNMHILTHDDVGKNVYNEIDGHPLSESKWATILNPLQACAACDLLQFCEYLGFDLEVSNWVMIPRIDWQDSNYSGWTINVQLRENNT